MNATEQYIVDALERGDVVIVVVVEGGCCTNVEINGVEVPYEIVDYDNEGVGE